MTCEETGMALACEMQGNREGGHGQARSGTAMEACNRGRCSGHTAADNSLQIRIGSGGEESPGGFSFFAFVGRQQRASG